MGQEPYKQVRKATASAPLFTPLRTGSLQRKCACDSTDGLSGDCEECSGKRLTVQRHTGGSAEASSAPPIVHDVLNSPGQPLDADTRAFMEPRFGHSFGRIPVFSTQPQRHSESLMIGQSHDQYEQQADASASRIADATAAATTERRADFGSVRVHTDSRAAESARAVGARAYTVGHQVVFDAGRYAPQTNEGRALLAHELTHVLQQTDGGAAGLRRQPEGGEKGKPHESAAKFEGCNDDRKTVIQEAIKKADALASRAVQAFEREYPYGYEQTAMQAHFGSLHSDQKTKIIERYKHVQSNLENKAYTCANKGKKVTEGDNVVDLCGEASCPGSKVTLFPGFGKETCPAGPVLLHEAVHNAGACDDIDKGSAYPPSDAENNAYSYEHFALAAVAGYATPELGKHKPTAPKIKD
jgi:hypothetical protein